MLNDRPRLKVHWVMMISCLHDTILTLILVVNLMLTGGEGPDELAEGHKADNESSPTSQPCNESVRRSTRERRPPAYLRDYVTDMKDSDQVLTSVDYCNKFSAFSQTYQEAMESPESSTWEAAMKEEMNSLTENNTFTLSTLPKGENSVGGRWVHTIKES